MDNTHLLNVNHYHLIGLRRLRIDQYVIILLCTLVIINDGECCYYNTYTLYSTPVSSFFKIFNIIIISTIDNVFRRVPRVRGLTRIRRGTHGRRRTCGTRLQLR